MGDRLKMNWVSKLETVTDWPLILSCKVEGDDSMQDMPISWIDGFRKNLVETQPLMIFHDTWHMGFCKGLFSGPLNSQGPCVPPTGLEFAAWLCWGSFTHSSEKGHWNEESNLFLKHSKKTCKQVRTQTHEKCTKIHKRGTTSHACHLGRRISANSQKKCFS